MDREVSQAALEKTDKCSHDMKCLKKDEKPICKVDRLINGVGAFLKPNGADLCPYKMSFGSAYICNCHTRYELYEKYSV